jgi:hypothetical protein
MPSSPVQKRGAVKNLNLKCKYGVVRFLATPQSEEEELVFQSDDPFQAMHELQVRVALDNSNHSHKLIFKEASGR